MKSYRPRGRGWHRGIYVRTSVFTVRMKSGPLVQVTRIRGPHRQPLEDVHVPVKTYYLETTLFEEGFVEED